MSRLSQAKKFMRAQPAVKALGSSADDLDSQIDALSKFAKTNEALFKKCILVVVKVAQTFSKANDLLNGSTGGRAKYVWGLMACCVAYLWFKVAMLVAAFCYRQTVGRVWGGSGAEGAVGSGGGSADSALSLEEQDMYGGAPAAPEAVGFGDLATQATAPAAAADEFDEF
jgi:hypothetical protein